MYNYKIEELKYFKMERTTEGKGNYLLYYKCENELSREEKIEILNFHKKGFANTMLDFLDARNIILHSSYMSTVIKTKRLNEIINQTINKLTNAGFIILRDGDMISYKLYHYYNLTDESKYGFSDIVDSWFHDLCEELNDNEVIYLEEQECSNEQIMAKLNDIDDKINGLQKIIDKIIPKSENLQDYTTHISIIHQNDLKQMKKLIKKRDK